MDHIAYLVGEFERITGHKLVYGFDRYHQWQSTNWSHTTRGAYTGLTFDHLKAELDRLVKSFRSKQ